MNDRETLRRLIELLPVLDLTWPPRMQKQWWRCLKTLMAWERDFERKCPREEIMQLAREITEDKAKLGQLISNQEWVQRIADEPEKKI